MDLPEVTQAWEANVAPYVAAMAEMIAATKDARDQAVAAMAEIQAAIDAIHGGDINIGVDATGAAAAAAATEDLAKAASDAAGASRDAAGSAYDEAAAYRMVTDAMGDAAKASAALIFADEALAFASREAGAAAADEGHTASDALHGIIGAMRGAGTATRFFGLSLSALHWIAGVSAELLAVTAPALIAFGAGLAVAMQGANNAYNHMTSLYGATEATNAAFHQTVGTTFGLKDALQQAQNAANPGVYEILGSAINDTKAHMDLLATAGLQTVHMWDEFSARITVDMQQMAKSGEAQSLLGNMVSDLQELGQVFGNVGHAILNFAADMPGLAGVLLMIVDDISKVILWISELPHGFILVAMALEEFYRWGGLAASIIARIGLALPALAGAPLTIAVGLFGRLAGIMGSITGVGAQLVSGLGKMAGAIAGEDIPVIGALSGKLSGLSEDMAGAAENTALMGTLGLAIAAFGGLAYAISRVKDADEQMAASSEKAVKAASDMQVLNVIASHLITLSHASDQANTSLSHMSSGMQTSGAAINMYSAASGTGLEGAMKITSSFAQNLSAGSQIISSAIPSFGSLAGAAAHLWASFSGASKAASDTVTLTQAQQSLIGTFHTVTGNISYLSHAYHISGAAAAALAQEAGVNLQDSLKGSGQAAQIARQQIANLVTGLGAMSAPAGVVGNDMQVLGIQSQLADTKVQQLNQAWDAWISSVTGSMSDFAQVQTALQGMQQDASASSASLTGSIGSVSRSASNMSYTLKGMGAGAMQSWQQFTSAVGQGNTAMDQLRTGMAEGVISSGSFESTVRGLVGEMIPFAAGNATATKMLSNLAAEAGGPVTTSVRQLADWTGVKGKAAADQFAKGMNGASLAMGGLSQAAQNLSATVSGDLNTAMAQSIANVTRIAPLTQTYVNDLHKYGSGAWQTKAALAALNGAQAEAAKLTHAAGIQSGQAVTAMHKEAIAAHELSHYLYSIPNINRTVTITTNDVYTKAGAAANANLLLHPKGGAHGGIVGPYGIIPSFAGGGVLPGYAPGVDNILAALSAGEGVLTPATTRLLGGAPMINWLNAMGEHGSAAGGAVHGGSGAGGGQMAEIHVHTHLDGKEIYHSQLTEALRWQTRNSGSRSGLSIPGRRVG